MSNKVFDRVGIKKPRYSGFNLSREQKLSCKMGELVPTYFEEIMPGDEFKVHSEIMVRFAPMLAPIMHRVDAYIHYFYVPLRIVWDEFQDFITGGKDGTSEPILPTFSLDAGASNPSYSKLLDYFGLPTVLAEQSSTLQVSQLPLRAYQLIFNEYYRDQNLQNEIDFTTGALTDIGRLRYRCWGKDYFTSALPILQRGEAVGIPIEPVYLDQSEVYLDNGGDPGSGVDIRTLTGGSGSRKLATELNDPIRIENLDTTSFDFTVNELRTSSALQRWLEKSARGGYRYNETILAQYGVHTGDARLQRPEYLGGGKTPLVVSEVVSTAKTLKSDNTLDNPVGEMAGHGISMGTSNSFRKRFTEHGYVIGILSVLPKTSYQQGIHRTWTRNDKFDFAWPELANLGEQEIFNYELFYDPDDDAYNKATFGYQQRYAEYKYGFSTVHGDFRNTLDFWHLGRIFGSQPNLNEDFVKSNPDTRIFAVTGTDHCWVQMYHNVKVRRALPFFADPRLI
ncbi:MAG: major capsid protein [Balneola sp.]